MDDEEAINWYCENAESPNARAPISLFDRPGLKIFAQLPEHSVPGLFYINGRTFAASSNLYELNTDGTFTLLGNLGTAPQTPTQIAANQNQLLILNNGALFVFTLTTNTFVAVNMAQFNAPVSQIGFADGYFFATLKNSNTFQMSQLEDGTTWSGLDIATVSLFPDNFSSFICDHREAWFFSSKKTAAYYNAGAGFPPFIPIQGAFLEQGAAAAFSTVQLDNSIFWLDRDERGSLIARRANGYVGTRISTHAVEQAWQQYKTISDAVGYSLQMNGHLWWVILFPSAPNGGATWVYDVTTQLWHRWAFWNATSGQFSAHRSMSHVFAFNSHLVGDWATGNIYQMSTDYSDDFGNPIRRLRRAPSQNDENKFIYYSQIEFEMETGLGPQPPLLDGNGQPRPPQVMLRWSDNGGKTWSNQYLLNCGKAGEYNVRVIRRMLGRARKRVWELSATDPVPMRIVDAYLKGEASTE